MKTYARFLEDGRVAETHVGNPQTAFVKAIADLFVEVPEGTQIEDKKTDKGWEKYKQPEPREVVRPNLLAENALKSFLTRAERIAFKAAASSDPVIEDFAEMIVLKPQDLDSAETVEAIDKLAELKVLTAARATALKNLEV